MSESMAWHPPEGVTAHDGGEIPKDLDFFAPQPAEIGPVRTAYSTLVVGGMPDQRWVRLAIAAVGLVGGAALGYVLPIKPGVQAGLIGAIPIGLLGLVIAAAITTFRFQDHVCHYVGRDGIAAFRWRRKVTPGPASVLRFEDATGLGVTIVDGYRNGNYSGTGYTFEWYRPRPAKPFVFSGMHKLKDGPYPTGENVNFGLAAERAWNAYQLPRREAELARSGWLKFDRKGGGFVALTPDAIAIRHGGKETILPYDDVGSVGLESGTLVIRSRGAKPGTFLAREQGVVRVPYGEVADGRLFLILADRRLAERAGRGAT